MCRTPDTSTATTEAIETGVADYLNCHRTDPCVPIDSGVDLCGICRDYQCFQSDFRIADWLWSSGSIALCHGICVCSAGICGITGKCSGIRGTAWKRMLMRCRRNPVHDSYCTCGHDGSGSLQEYGVAMAQNVSEGLREENEDEEIL